jgi:hypothetical protein
MLSRHKYVLTLSPWLQRERGNVSKGKAKVKRGRSDDIPPEPSPEAKDQYNKLVSLREELFCNAHSADGRKTFCWIERAGEGGAGGHREINHEQMTQWAKHIVSQIIT